MRKRGYRKSYGKRRSFKKGYKKRKFKSIKSYRPSRGGIRL